MTLQVHVYASISFSLELVVAGSAIGLAMPDLEESLLVVILSLPS